MHLKAMIFSCIVHSMEREKEREKRERFENKWRIVKRIIANRNGLRIVCDDTLKFNRGQVR